MASKGGFKSTASNDKGAEQGNHIGRLGKLPNELFFYAFQHLDMQSLSRLSQTCVGARHIVHGYLPYQEIIERAEIVLIGLRNARKPASFTADHMFRQVLCSDQCACCGQAGSYVYLLTCERVCGKCFVSKDDFRMVSSWLVSDLLELTDENLAALPRLYCTWDREYFISLKHVKEAALSAAPDFFWRMNALSSQLKSQSTSTSFISVLD